MILVVSKIEGICYLHSRRRVAKSKIFKLFYRFFPFWMREELDDSSTINSRSGIIVKYNGLKKKGGTKHCTGKECNLICIRVVKWIEHLVLL